MAHLEVVETRAAEGTRAAAGTRAAEATRAAAGTRAVWHTRGGGNTGGGGNAGGNIGGGSSGGTANTNGVVFDEKTCDVNKISQGACVAEVVSPTMHRALNQQYLQILASTPKT